LWWDWRGTSQSAELAINKDGPELEYGPLGKTRKAETPAQGLLVFHAKCWDDTRTENCHTCYVENPFGEPKSETEIDQELEAHLSRVGLNHDAHEMAKRVAAKYIAGK
jgi:hypothetical protein